MPTTVPASATSPAPAHARTAAPGRGRASAWALALLAALACGAAPAQPSPAQAGAAAAPGAAAQAPTRPRIGLVLGGGGARGAAHVGVLEVLEQLRVPVDCVAGTSMGALVAGAWAAGVAPALMRELMAGADWADMFIDNPEYTELDLRSRRLAQRFLPGTETGVGLQGTRAPAGVVSGQKIQLFINRLVGADRGERRIEALPVPLSIVATDIGSGARVVFRSGTLTQAMRASMAVPGLLAPVAIDGRLLVDGGLVDNLPVAEVRQRCGAEVVIAVNVGSPLLAPGEIGGLVTITAQMVALLTEQNVTRSLALLGPRDLLLQPDLEGIGAASFPAHAEAAGRGRAAALEMAPALTALALDESAYATHRRGWHGPQAEPPRIDAVEVAGLSRVNPAVLRG